MNFLYKVILFFFNKIDNLFSQTFGILLFKVNHINFQQGIVFNGLPKISIQGKLLIGENFKINSKLLANPIGRNYKCIFIVRKDAILSIGNNTGMSGTAIVCQKKITICDNVKFGGNVCVYDTDFHALDPQLRTDPTKDRENTVKKDVVIHDNVFIGAYSTILKGVIIGKNSIIGACSVVSKNIPENEIWAGNPAKFIRKINFITDIMEDIS